MGSELSSKHDTHLPCAHLCKYFLTGICLLGFVLLSFFFFPNKFYLSCSSMNHALNRVKNALK